MSSTRLSLLDRLEQSEESGLIPDYGEDVEGAENNGGGDGGAERDEESGDAQQTGDSTVARPSSSNSLPGVREEDEDDDDMDGEETDDDLDDIQAVGLDLAEDEDVDGSDENIILPSMQHQTPKLQPLSEEGAGGSGLLDDNQSTDDEIDYGYGDAGPQDEIDKYGYGYEDIQHSSTASGAPGSPGAGGGHGPSPRRARAIPRTSVESHATSHSHRSSVESLASSGGSPPFAGLDCDTSEEHDYPHTARRTTIKGPSRSDRMSTSRPRRQNISRTSARVPGGSGGDATDASTCTCYLFPLKLEVPTSILFLWRSCCSLQSFSCHDVLIHGVF